MLAMHHLTNSLLTATVVCALSLPASALATNLSVKTGTPSQISGQGAEDSSTPPLPAYIYNPSGRRDPFQAPIIMEEPVVETPIVTLVPQRPKEPLEEFHLDSLKLVAILQRDEREPLAMIQDPSGKGFTVRVGNYLGTQEGRIVRIALNAVELVESVPTIKDRDATRTTILRLHDQEEME